MCYRVVENHVLKEWHWLGSRGSLGRPDSSVHGKCPEVLGSAGSSSPETDHGSPWAPALLTQHQWCLLAGTQPGRGCGSGLAEAPLLVMSWLDYDSSSPADTVSRMATGRWSVRPDSWVIKLNSSTSAFQSGHSPSSVYSM